MTRDKFPLILLTGLAVLVGACAPKQVKKNADEETQKAAQKKPGEPGYQPPTEVTEASLRGSGFNNIDGLDAIRFDYDSANLKDEALAALKRNAEYIKGHAEDVYLVAGFCDERGTIEYNLALGQKRAKQVREYYIRLGVPGSSVATISYGKENPLCSESTEECWAQNRRAETRARSRTASASQPAQTPQ